MRYALARRRARRRALQAAEARRLIRILERGFANSMRAASFRLQDVVEASERMWCRVNGIPYEAIVPGSLVSDGHRETVTLAEPLVGVRIVGHVEP